MSAVVVGSELLDPEEPPLAPLTNASVLLCATVKQDALERSFVRSFNAIKYHAMSALDD